MKPYRKTSLERPASGHWTGDSIGSDDWTGEPDRMAGAVLGLVLALGAIGFLIVAVLEF